MLKTLYINMLHRINYPQIPAVLNLQTHRSVRQELHRLAFNLKPKVLPDEHTIIIDEYTSNRLPKVLISKSSPSLNVEFYFGSPAEITNYYQKNQGTVVGELEAHSSIQYHDVRYQDTRHNRIVITNVMSQEALIHRIYNWRRNLSKY